jgi:hypothetical protein
MRTLAAIVAVVMGLGACGPGGGNAGAPCTSNAECSSNKCAGIDCPMHCLCASDSDCPDGKHCMMTTDCGPGCF